MVASVDKRGPSFKMVDEEAEETRLVLVVQAFDGSLRHNRRVVGGHDGLLSTSGSSRRTGTAVAMRSSDHCCAQVEMSRYRSYFFDGSGLERVRARARVVVQCSGTSKYLP